VVKPVLAGVRVLAAINGLELFGHERGNIEVFKALRDCGAEVIVGVNQKRHNQVALKLISDGFQVFSLPFGTHWSKKRLKREPWLAATNVLSLLQCSWAFSEKIRAYRPTHIHLGSPLAYSYLSLALACHKVPLIYRMGDAPPVDSPFNFRIWRSAIRRTDHLVCNSEFVRDAVFRSIGVTGSVIYSLAPIDLLGNGIPAPGEQRGAPRVVYVGAVAEHKGLIPLIEAFGALVQNFEGIQLDIVGGSRWDGDFRKRAQTLVTKLGVQNQVQFHGHVEDPTSFYENACLHIAPSIWEEPLGNVVMEAKCRVRPSLIFPSGGLPEMVRHKEDGYICEDKSSRSLLEGLRWMLADKDRLQRMGKAAQSDYQQRFGRQRFLDQWASVYLETAGR
jgi:glycosyltransferase involved in cell wall biosynthesis